MIVRLSETASTMIEAARLAEEGAPHMSVAVADRQTAGQGRHGHSWDSPVGGLYCTFVLRLDRPAPQVTLAIGLAVKEAVGVPCDIRWPNDILIGRRKLAGILCTLHQSVILAGIGVNLCDVGREDAAWLEGVSRDALLQRVSAAIPPMLAVPLPDLLRLFAASSSYVNGCRAFVEGHGPGVTEGLDEHGFLLFRKDDGTRVTVMAGGVRPL